VLEDLARRQEEEAGTHAFQAETRQANQLLLCSVVSLASFARRCSTCTRLLCFFKTLSVQLLRSAFLLRRKKEKMIIVIGFAVNLAHRARTWRLPPTVNCFLFFLFD
jgi:hypothetical protein